jgi:hypothetical protein
MKENKSIRLRTEPGSSKNINVKIQQEFDTIDFLSLKITQDEAYRNFCSDYGVVAGRVIANDGFGVENAKISIFIPLSDEDAEDPVISSIYPYISPTDVNGEGIRYNLLPRLGKEFTITKKVPNNPTTGIPQSPNNLFATNNYTPLGSFVDQAWVGPISQTFGKDGFSIWRRTVSSTKGPTVPVGTFPSKFEMLDNNSLLEVHEKYYKYTTRTNGSGDYMIFGVPVGVRTVHMDVDLSDTGAASLTVDDYTNLGFPAQQFDGNKFRSSTNLDELPQIEAQNLPVDVIPFWGNTEQCEIGITRLDFKLTKTITPSAILFFQAFTNGSDWRLKHTCNDINGGSAGNFRSIGNMQTKSVVVEAIAASNGEDIQPLTFPNGNVIYPLPMYEDKFVTNEFGDLVPSNDPNKGIPTGGRYKTYVYSSDRNITDINGDDYGYATYVIEEGNNFIKFRYDLDNRKRLLYTPGNYNASIEGLGQDNDRTSIAGNQNINNQRLRYPATYKNGGEDRFGNIDGEQTGIRTPICYGSLYMMRIRHKSDQFCDKVALSVSSGLPGGGVLRYGTRIGAYGVLDVTDILRIFSDFGKGGGIGSSTSAYLNIYSNGNPGFGANDIPIENQAIPLGSTGQEDNDGVVTFPNRLNEEDITITKVRFRGVPPLAKDTGEESTEAWYYFFFGLLENNNAIINLKNNLGV